MTTKENKSNPKTSIQNDIRSVVSEQCSAMTKA